MGFGVGQSIEDVDYTTVYDKIKAVYGPVSTGYGQSMSANPVVADPTKVITAAEWNDLKSYIINARVHQIGTTGVTNAFDADQIAVGRIIKYNEHLKLLNDIANACVTDKYLMHSSQYSEEQSATYSYTSGWGGGANRTLNIKVELTATVFDGSTWRGFEYYFNAGGSLRFTFERTGGSSNSKNTSWSNLLSNVGAVDFNYTRTDGAGNTSSGNTLGFQDIPNNSTFYEIFKRGVVDGGVYSENNMTVSVSNSSNAKLIFHFRFDDVDSGDQRPGGYPGSPFGPGADGSYNPLGPAEDESVDGTLNVKIFQRRPSGVYVNVTGFSYSAPSGWYITNG